MSAPTEIQHRQLQHLLGNFVLPIPVHSMRHEDGSIQIDAGNPFVIRDGDQMDTLLNDLMDIDAALDSDDLFNRFLELLGTYSVY